MLLKRQHAETFCHVFVHFTSREGSVPSGEAFLEKSEFVEIKLLKSLALAECVCKTYRLESEIIGFSRSLLEEATSEEREKVKSAVVSWKKLPLRSRK